LFGLGHGCGHNLLGSGAALAAVALKEYMERNHVSGTLRYFGTPAEEGGEPPGEYPAARKQRRFTRLIRPQQLA